MLIKATPLLRPHHYQVKKKKKKTHPNKQKTPQQQQARPNQDFQFTVISNSYGPVT